MCRTIGTYQDEDKGYLWIENAASFVFAGSSVLLAASGDTVGANASGWTFATTVTGRLGSGSFSLKQLLSTLMW